MLSKYFLWIQREKESKPARLLLRARYCGVILSPARGSVRLSLLITGTGWCDHTCQTNTPHGGSQSDTGGREGSTLRDT